MPMKTLCLTTLALASALTVGHSLAQDGSSSSSGAAAASATLPDGFEILDRYVEAIGGEDRYREHKNEKMSGSYKMEAMGVDGSIEILRASVTKTLITVELGVLGQAVQGTNGEVAWASQPGQPLGVIEGPEADRLINEANYYAIVEPRKTYTSAETVGIVMFEDLKCYKVNLLTSWGQHAVGLFEVESGLHRKTSTRDSLETDVFTSEITYSDFREVEGIKRPYKMTIVAAAMMGIEQIIEFDTIEFDADIKLGTFDPPGSF